MRSKRRGTVGPAAAIARPAIAQLKFRAGPRRHGCCSTRPWPIPGSAWRCSPSWPGRLEKAVTTVERVVTVPAERLRDGSIVATRAIRHSPLPARGAMNRPTASGRRRVAGQASVLRSWPGDSRSYKIGGHDMDGARRSTASRSLADARPSHQGANHRDAVGQGRSPEGTIGQNHMTPQRSKSCRMSSGGGSACASGVRLPDTSTVGTVGAGRFSSGAALAPERCHGTARGGLFVLAGFFEVKVSY